MPADTSISQRIRERLQAKGQRYHANDNISAFIEPGELDQLTKEVEARSRACSKAWSSTSRTTTTRSKPRAAWPRCT